MWRIYKNQRAIHLSKTFSQLLHMLRFGYPWNPPTLESHGNPVLGVNAGRAGYYAKGVEIWRDLMRYPGICA
jgi:hypothetical protein